MNTKFTILVAAGLLIAGVSQAQGTVAANDIAFNNPRHTVVRDHKVNVKARHEIRKNRKHMKHNRHKHRMHRHHK